MHQEGGDPGSINDGDTSRSNPNLLSVAFSQQPQFDNQKWAGWEGLMFEGCGAVQPRKVTCGSAHCRLAPVVA